MLLKRDAYEQKHGKEYKDFVARLLASEAEEKGGVPQELSASEILGDDEKMQLYFSDLLERGVEATVPRAARRFLSAFRVRRGFKSLSDCMEIGDMVRGHERLTPASRKQA